MFKNYMIMKDKVVAFGDNKVTVFDNTEKNELKLDTINALQVADRLYDADIDEKFIIEKDRKDAKKKLKTAIPTALIASSCVSYLLAHLTLVPWDGDVSKLLTSFGIHAVIISSGMIAALVHDAYANCSQADLNAILETLKQDEDFIMRKEVILDEIALDEDVFEPKKDKQEVVYDIDTETVERRTTDLFNLNYIHNRYNKNVKKAYLKGTLFEYLTKLGIVLDKDMYESFIARIEDDLYKSNEVTHERVVRKLAK